MSGFAAMALPIAIGMQGVSAMAAAQAQQQEAASQAAALTFNANLERDRQGQIKDAGTDAERQHRRMARIAIGRNKAQIGGSGLALTGQRQDILRQDAMQAELDALQIRENTNREVAASKQQEAVDRFQAKQTLRQGGVNARTTLITGALGGVNTFLGAR